MLNGLEKRIAAETSCSLGLISLRFCFFAACLNGLVFHAKTQIKGGSVLDSLGHSFTMGDT
jgi:hypothetical protein